MTLLTPPVAPATTLAVEGASPVLLGFYERFYAGRPAEGWPTSDRYLGKLPITPWSMFAALNFVVGYVMAQALTERGRHRAPPIEGVRAVAYPGPPASWGAHPYDVFAVAFRWVMRCTVARSGAPREEDRLPWFTPLDDLQPCTYRPEMQIDDLLPWPWVVVLATPNRVASLQTLVDEAFDFEWWARAQFDPPARVGRWGGPDWDDPLGRFWCEKILGGGWSTRLGLDWKEQWATTSSKT